MNFQQYCILIIDDCAEDRELYRRYLNRDRVVVYSIAEVESGEDALEKLEFIQPDLILLDYLLPDLNGLEFIEELKRQTNKLPPIIMLTGQGSEAIAVEAMKSGVKDYLVKGQLTPEKLYLSVNNVLQQTRLKFLLTKNRQQQQLIAETALRIRQSLNLSEILNTTVQEVQLLLKCDRVIIYRFADDRSGDVVAESVKSDWKKSLGKNIVDTCFQTKGFDKYQRGMIQAFDDVSKAGLSECHLNLLEQFQVKASVIVPILLRRSPSQDDSFCLWGLLIAHQCSSSRHWAKDEIELLDKLAVQLAIAIQQAELLDSLQQELDNRDRLEAELARLVKVLETSEDYIELADIRGRIIWNNTKMKQAVQPSEDVDLNQLSISDYHPTWALNLVKEEGIPTAIKEGSWLGETTLKIKDGREIPVSQLILAHKSPQGKVEYLSTVMRDLSTQKQAEKSLTERAKELEWVNQQLLRTTYLLKKRNHELDQFAYVTSHDLKAPLRAIANIASWLSEDLDGQIPEENQYQLNLLQSRVKRLDGFIQALLKYSRVGRNTIPQKIVNVAELLRETIDSLSPPPRMEIEIAPEMPIFQTDEVMLQQVFANLIGNAIKYHHQDTGKITISVEDSGDFYRFAVTDDGPGIETQYHEKIFVIFQTLQARDKLESTGIGLSIVKKIVEDRGGEITVESEVGKGSTFYFTWRK